MSAPVLSNSFSLSMSAITFRPRNTLRDTALLYNYRASVGKKPTFSEFLHPYQQQYQH